MQILGLDIDGKIVNISLLNSNKEIIDLNSFDLSAVKPLYIDKTLNKNALLTTGLDANKVLIKHKSLKMTKKKAIEKALPYQTELSSALNKEKSIIIPLLGKKHSNNTDLFFHITTTRALQEHLNALSEKDIDPDVVSSKASALVRFVKFHFHNINDVTILHIGKEQSTLVFMENSFAKSSYFIKIGSDDLLKDSQSKMDGSYTILDFSKIPQNQFSTVHKTFYNELGRVFFLLEKIKNKKVPLLLTGQIGFFKNLDQYIFSKFSNFFSECLELNKPMQLPYAISIGLAIEALDEDKKSLQFRQNQFVPLKHFKKVGTTVISIFLCSILLSFLLLFHGKTLINDKENILLKNISLLEEKEHLNLKHLSDESLKNVLLTYDKKIENESKAFPYFFQFPKVSDLLKWVNSLPIFQSNDSIDIKLFNYQILKDEKESKILDAKVCIEFIASDVNAKKFLEQIKKGILVDSLKTITFESEKNLYKTSFFLKKSNSYDQ